MRTTDQNLQAELKKIETELDVEEESEYMILILRDKAVESENGHGLIC